MNSLVELDELSKLLANVLPQIVWTAQPDGSIDYYSQRWTEYTGYTSEETLGWAWNPVLHPDDLQRTIDLWTQAVQTGEPYTIEYRFLRASDQTYRWHLGLAVPLRDDNGTIVKWLGTSTDIHTQKEHEEALVKREAELVSLAESLPQIVWVSGADSAPIYVNQRWAEATGESLEMVLEGKSSAAIHPDDLEGLNRSYTVSVEQGIPYEFEYRLKNKHTGIYRWYLGRVVPVHDDTGSVIRWFGTGTDIDDIKRHKEIESKLELDRDLAIEAARLRSEFLANMSHEIRTPMNGILGMVDLLSQTEVTDEQQSYLDLMKDSSETLLTIIDDILDFSKIESGRISLEITELNIATLIRSVNDLLRPKTAAKAVDLYDRVSSSLPMVLYGDPHRIKQILLNLVGNAAKFTQRGEITVSAKQLSATREYATIEISVADTGIGISENMQAALFNPFQQGDASTTRNFGGTGLGLSIARSLVEAMGGSITVKSELNQGSTFTFVIKLLRVSQDAFASSVSLENEVERQDSVSEGARILVVEDNPTNAILISAYLKRWGLPFEHVHNGVEALEIIATTTYDLIIMDCQMPGLDGYATSMEIRAREMEDPARARIPIIALTANVMEGDRERCIEAGMDDFLGKPFRSDELLASIQRHLAPATQ